MHQQYDVDLLVAAVKLVLPEASQRALDEAVSAVKTLAASTESDAWKELGNRFFEVAKAAQNDSDVFTYCLFGGAFLGHSVDLARTRKDATFG